MVAQTYSKLTTHINKIAIDLIAQYQTKKDYQWDLSIKILTKTKLIKGHKDIKKVLNTETIKR